MKSIERNRVFFMIALMAMQLLAIRATAQPVPSYVFTYDGSGNRLTRTYQEIILKAGDTTLIESSVGVHDILIYPNPTKGLITLNIANLGKDDDVKMTLHNITGDLIFSPVLNNQESTIDMSKHPNGTYFLRVIIGARSETFKIVKLE
jgi:hypothetical protein